MQAELIFTGTELLLGEVLNTHAQYLGQRLSALGIEVARHTTIGDQWDRLAGILRRALDRSALVITTGGLGPTTDDLTKETAAGVLGLGMVLDQPSLEQIKEFMARRGMVMPESMARQACFPAGAKILPNPRGTAPGALLEHNGKILALLPGPPGELRAMFEQFLEPYLAGLSDRGIVARSRLLKVTGISESVVQQRIGDLGGQTNPGIAYLAKPGEVHVRISARHADPAQADRMVAGLLEKVRHRLSGFIFGMDDEVLEEVVGRLLTESGLTLALAESCTGGLIAARLTAVAGSSEYFLGGVVAYHNRIKEQVLGVPAEVLAAYGAVSRETAVAMSEGVRRLSGADFGLGVTGIAGPGGGSTGKPVGLVYIALAAADGTCCREFHFPGRRQAIRQGAANTGLNMIRLRLLAQ
ncbi:competence/damage-inducible protein A [Desulfotomaculum copahuensis]|uniref:Putative competence-damage inducible protein n=1 Tax=Desulfotomaculum copahuensis TaxID=1838280 RepID=A0A1B7LJH1_9FIRM|nr:competence/damage-inducible protein A [Desulfotomaculum copahuensis]OAT86693.1 competence/damage-inducible protein A [Desulfotomaculum copahuensis]